MRKRIRLFFLILAVLLYSENTHAFKVDTHKDISEKAAENSVLGLESGDYLKNLGFSENIDKTFKLNEETKSIREWIRDGSLKEDDLLTARFFNHFHNPLFPSGQWNQAGLDRDYIVPLSFLTLTHLSGESSLLWAQNEINNEWSWQKVRDYYYLALTSSTDDQREANFAKTFKGLGHIIHLIQDSAQPAHTRNDPHPLDGLGIIKGFEWWTFKNAKKLNLFDITPDFPTVSLGTSVGGYTPITQFWDTDQYDGTNPPAGTNIGISEYTNANFFSEDTINALNFPYPQINQNTIVEREFTNTLWNTTFQRQYYLKDCCGETNGGLGYLLSAVDYWDYYRQILGIGPPIKPVLDNNVYEDYATLLIPRAIGYSAGLIDYFFRGEIEVIQIPDSNNIKIKNNSSEAMDGIFTLYYDATDGTRKPVSDGSWSRSLQPVNTTADTSDELSFTEPTDIAEGKEYILVFQGTLGSESNAVVGKKWVFCNNATAIFVAGPASGSIGEYDFAVVSASLDPTKINWIAWNDVPQVQLTRPSRPGEVFLGPGGIGTNDYITLTVVAPSGASQTIDIDLNDAFGVSFGIQNVIFGSAANAPDVFRQNPSFANPPNLERFLDEGGSHNAIFSEPGSYEFQFSFRDETFGGGGGGHGNIYLLISCQGVVVP